MLIRLLLPLCLLALPGGCALSPEEKAWERMDRGNYVAGDDALLAEALREVMYLAADRAATALARPGAIAGMPALRITLPPEASGLANGLRAYGLGRLVENVQGDMNRVAEVAANRGRAVLREQVDLLTFHEPRALRRDSEPTLTLLLGSQQRERLLAAWRPVVQAAMDEAGYTQSLDIMVRHYDDIPILADLPTRPDYTDWITARALDIMLQRMADEEREIRTDPRARTSTRMHNLFDELPY